MPRIHYFDSIMSVTKSSGKTIKIFKKNLILAAILDAIFGFFKPESINFRQLS